MLLAGSMVKILLLEASAKDQDLVCSSLSSELVEISHFPTLQEGLIYLQEHEVSLILSDLNLTDSQGLNTVCKLTRANQQTPIVILSDTNEYDLAIQAVKVGAQDFIFKKDVNASSLMLQLRFAIERHVLRRQLREAQDKAVRQSEFKSQFLARFSHEIRNPLNAIIGTVELLSQTELSKEQNDYLGHLDKGSERLLGLLNDILDIAKIESGKMNIENEVLELPSLVEDVIQMFSAGIRNKRLFVTDFIHPDVGQILCSDAKRLRQILANLISNAIKFTDQGHIVVSVLPAGNGVIEISVEDSGRGISEEKIHGIFDPYEQFRIEDESCGTGLGLSVCSQLASLLGGQTGAESQLNEGSRFWFTFRPASVEGGHHLLPSSEKVIHKKLTVFGLSKFQVEVVLSQLHLFYSEFEVVSSLETLQALAIDPKRSHDLIIIDSDFSKEVIRELDQYIQVEHSRWNQIVAIGYHSFRDHVNNLGIPYRQRSLVSCIEKQANRLLTAAVSPEEETMSVEETDRNFCKLKCLIVDDEPINQHVMRAMLSKFGLETDYADNGQEALQKLENDAHYDIVFMDFAMPVMDGVEATKLLRRRGDDVTVVALTGKAFEKDKKTCFDAGMNHFISKPVQMDDLGRTLKEIAVACKKKFVS